MVLVEERRSSDTRLPAQVGQALPVPGSVTLKLPPVQANWVNVQRSLQLELKDGDRVVWQESQLPRGVAVMVNNRPCKLTATVVGDQVRIDLEEVKTGLRASTK
jgi:hypothetical protein